MTAHSSRSSSAERSGRSMSWFGATTCGCSTSFTARLATGTAQDLVQETFVRVYRHLHRFDQTKKFSTWAYTIAGNLAKNELRNRSRNPLVLFQTIKKNWDADHRPLEWEDNTYRPDDLYRKRHLKEMIDRAVEQLPEHHREVFVLREMEGKTYEEISEVTGVNLGTVKSRLNRARNNFAQIIAPMLD